MKNKELYSIFIVCLLMMSSCLGDTNTQITVGEQEAVYQTRPTQGFFLGMGWAFPLWYQFRRKRE